VLDGLTRLTPRLEALSSISHLIQGTGHRAPVRQPGTVDRQKLRDAVIALDGTKAGATRREIATVIYGTERVRREWDEPTGRLKAVIKRYVQRG
jgi:hypothetical protein